VPNTHFVTGTADDTPNPKKQQWSRVDCADLQIDRIMKSSWRYRLTVRTEPSQGLNTGSIPVSATNYFRIIYLEAGVQAFCRPSACKLPKTACKGSIPSGIRAPMPGHPEFAGSHAASFGFARLALISSRVGRGKGRLRGACPAWSAVVRWIYFRASLEIKVAKPR
jgi:hypothetical protein